MRGNYFSYDGCKLFPADDDIMEDQLMELAADVLIEILEEMRKTDT